MYGQGLNPNLDVSGRTGSEIDASTLLASQNGPGAASRPLVSLWIRFCGDAAASLGTTSRLSMIQFLVLKGYPGALVTPSRARAFSMLGVSNFW